MMIAKLLKKLNFLCEIKLKQNSKKITYKQLQQEKYDTSCNKKAKSCSSALLISLSFRFNTPHYTHLDLMGQYVS